MSLPPLPWTVKGSRIYAADGEEIVVATKASPRYRHAAEETAAAIVTAMNAAVSGAASSDPRVTPFAPSPEHVLAMDRVAQRSAHRTPQTPEAIRADMNAARASVSPETRAAVLGSMKTCSQCGGSVTVRLNVPGHPGVCGSTFHGPTGLWK